MVLIADLHIHSRFSRATSRDLDFIALHRGALEKGIHLLGTGDFTHPGWMKEIETQLEPAPNGLFRLRPEFRRAAEADLPSALAGDVQFVLQVEISNIYKQDGAVRKNHNLVYMPDLDAARAFSKKLAAIGNIASDGRPILGLSARNLLEITLETDPLAYLIPAHIWTPWFSALGSKSGFNSLDECFGDLSSHIFAVETGLSSDPPMNWRLSDFDRLTLVSNSDAHSTARLAREATLFDIEPGYEALLHALLTRERYCGTLEFYPEEGKYHLDGHRGCNCRLTPEETLANGGLCPVCAKPVTVGVASRVAQLADRPQGFRPANAAPFESIVPLAEVVAEAVNAGVTSGKTTAAIAQMRAKLGPELFILREAPLENIATEAGPPVAEAIRRVRAGELAIEGGYDGEYGAVKIFHPSERDHLMGQMFFIARGGPSEKPKRMTVSAPSRKKAADQIDLLAMAEQASLARQEKQVVLDAVINDPLFGLDQDQRRCAAHMNGPLLVVAGPGTGKTRTLAARMAYQIKSGVCASGRMLAIAFTRQATAELEDRLRKILPSDLTELPRVTTFHGFGLSVLQEFTKGALPRLIDDEERVAIIAALVGLSDAGETADSLGEQISLAKGHCDPLPHFVDRPAIKALFEQYEAALVTHNAMDVDDLVWRAYHLIENEPGLADFVANRLQSVSVDEYQDVNDVQAALIHRISRGGRTLMAIGDPDQAIYGFRGAKPGHFARFMEVYSGAHCVTLGTTYRLTDHILKVAGGVLRPTGVYRTYRHGVKVEVMGCPTAASEAEQIVVRLEKLVGGTSHFALDSGRGEGEGQFGFSDIAVLVRTRAQRQEIVDALGRSGVPCLPIGADEPHDPRSQKVAVMTMHASKGREFEVVFIAGVEPGLSPLSAGRLVGDEAEERRLLYVAITRARTLCILSYAARRTLFGIALPGGPSPFLSDLPQSSVAAATADVPKNKPATSQLSLL